MYGIRGLAGLGRLLYGLNEKLVKMFRENLECCENTIENFELKYGCSLEELEKRIERDGVPLDNPKLWEDIMEWRKAVKEMERLRTLLKELF